MIDRKFISQTNFDKKDISITDDNSKIILQENIFFKSQSLNVLDKSLNFPDERLNSFPVNNLPNTDQRLLNLESCSYENSLLVNPTIRSGSLKISINSDFSDSSKSEISMNQILPKNTIISSDSPKRNSLFSFKDDNRKVIFN